MQLCACNLLTSLSVCRWKDKEHTKADNVELVTSSAVLDLLLGAHAISGKPLVIHFFGQQCPGCKAMHPKLQQIMQNNGDFTFAMVRDAVALQLWP